jgi:hypothetical protein
VYSEAVDHREDGAMISSEILGGPDKVAGYHFQTCLGIISIFYSGRIPSILSAKIQMMHLEMSAGKNWMNTM